MLAFDYFLFGIIIFAVLGAILQMYSKKDTVIVVDVQSGGGNTGDARHPGQSNGVNNTVFPGDDPNINTTTESSEEKALRERIEAETAVNVIEEQRRKEEEAVVIFAAEAAEKARIIKEQEELDRIAALEAAAEEAAKKVTLGSDDTAFILYTGLNYEGTALAVKPGQNILVAEHRTPTDWKAMCTAWPYKSMKIEPGTVISFSGNNFLMRYNVPDLQQWWEGHDEEGRAYGILDTHYPSGYANLQQTCNVINGEKWYIKYVERRKEYSPLKPLIKLYTGKDFTGDSRILYDIGQVVPIIKKTGYYPPDCLTYVYKSMEVEPGTTLQMIPVYSGVHVNRHNFTVRYNIADLEKWINMHQKTRNGVFNSGLHGEYPGHSGCPGESEWRFKIIAEPPTAYEDKITTYLTLYSGKNYTGESTEVRDLNTINRIAGVTSTKYPCMNYKVKSIKGVPGTQFRMANITHTGGTEWGVTETIRYNVPDLEKWVMEHPDVGVKGKFGAYFPSARNLDGYCRTNNNYFISTVAETPIDYVDNVEPLITLWPGANYTGEPLHIYDREFYANFAITDTSIKPTCIKYLYNSFKGKAGTQIQFASVTPSGGWDFHNTTIYRDIKDIKEWINRHADDPAGGGKMGIFMPTDTNFSWCHANLTFYIIVK
jgi:hypothetical protein